MATSPDDSRKKRDVAEVDDDVEQKPKKVKSSSTPVASKSITTKRKNNTLKSPPKTTTVSSPISNPLHIQGNPGQSTASNRKDSKARPSKTPVSANQKSDQQIPFGLASSAEEKQLSSSSPSSVALPPASREQSLPGSNRIRKGRGQWDLESALHHICQTDPSVKEEISDDQWISFRVGHAGDASRIAQIYHRTTHATKPVGKKDQQAIPTKDSPISKAPAHRHQPQKNDAKDNDKNDREVASNLELWLSEGMGDEDHPPSVYALLIHLHQDELLNEKSTSNKVSRQEVNSNEKEAEKGNDPVLPVSIVLMTQRYTNGERILRLEWLYIDTSLDAALRETIERRLWLRLSTLALMTGCQRLTAVEAHTTKQSSVK